MFARIGTTIVSTAVLLALAGALRAADDKGGLSKEDRAKAEAAVKEYMEKKNANARLTAVADDAVAKVLPDFACFAVVFPQYPLAREAPEPFKAGNVFAVTKGGKLTHLTDAKGLEKFFKDHAAPAKDEAGLKAALEAWLRLSQEFHQDGIFKFTFVKDAVKVTTEKDDKKVSGKTTVGQGGNKGDKGDLSVTLAFDDKGKLSKVTEEAKLQAGIRPICQATKLLDPDPTVRAMAEKDLLVLGRDGKEYLDAQRARATPELQKAIDRVWKRIVEEGW